MVIALLAGLAAPDTQAQTRVQTVVAAPRHEADRPPSSQARSRAVPVIDATQLRQSTQLEVGWLVKEGDDPSFASSDFDDSTWQRFDARQSVKPLFPDHPPEVLWYRLHLKTDPSQAGLALLEHQLSSAFEIYLNGQKVMSTGQVKPFAPYAYGARILAPVPPAMLQTGAVVIALRVHISRTEWDSSGPGYAAENLTLGQYDVLEEHRWYFLVTHNAAPWFIEILGAGIGIVALALYTAQRRRSEYLWIFLQFAASAAALPLSYYELTHNVPAYWDLFRQLFSLASLFFEILMFMAFLGERFNWPARILLALTAVGMTASAFGQAQGTFSVLMTVLAQIPLLFLLAGALPLLLIRHLRRGNREAGILLLPILLLSLNIYLQLIDFLMSEIPATSRQAIEFSTLLTNVRMGPFVTSLNQVSNLFYALSIAIIMVLRSTRDSRQQALYEGELAAAREVQQVLLPDAFEPVPGYAIETAYQPAQQVGGDFFQILPTVRGGMLLVVGDVAGKGLPAAMLVSVLVGAIRSTAEYTTDPAALLANLNDRLVGRSGGSFSTALVAHFTCDGFVSIANAGHLSPYLDGVEVELPGALPLGISHGIRYEVSQSHLSPGSRLTFYSDGVIEAQNPAGDLLGFERGRLLSTEPASVIAATARDFGQSDDITVVAITRSAAIAEAA